MARLKYPENLCAFLSNFPPHMDIEISDIVKTGKASSERELNVLEFLQYIEIHRLFVTIWISAIRYGMMECWIIGIVRIKCGKSRFTFFFLATHYSSIPLFQYSRLSEANFRMSEKIFLSSEERVFHRSHIKTHRTGET
jgi:hypothetical protein